MACELQQDFALSACKEGVGGVATMYVANWDKVDWANATETNGLYTALAMLNVGDQFFTYDLVKQTSNFTETITASVENGTVFYEQLFTLIWNTMDLNKRNELLLLARANTAVIFATNEETPTYWLMGVKNGVDVNGGTTNSGTAFGDRNGYEITFQGLEPEPVFEVDAALIPVLSAPKV